MATSLLLRIHLSLRALAAAFVLFSLLGNARTQGGWSHQYDLPGFGIAGRVFALGTFRNELIAGTYRTPTRDGQTIAHVARFDGVRWHPLGSGVNGHVRAVYEFQGELWVGGMFGVAGGLTALGVARWDGTQWRPAGAGLSGEVWCFTEHQGQLYAGGEFVVSGTQTVRSLARWTGTAWQEVGGGIRRAGWATTTVRTLLSDGGQLYVGGDFDQAGTTTVGRVAAWNGTTWSSLAGGVQGSMVWSLVAHQGRVFCGGFFGQAGSAAADNVAAWNGIAWSSVGAGVQDSTYGAGVMSLCVHGNELFVAGQFTASGGTTLWRVARYDGTALQPIGGVALAEANPPAIIATASWNGRLWCGGEFHLAGDPAVAGGTKAAYHVAAFDGTSWHQAGPGLGMGNEVHTLGSYLGQPVAGGRFVTAGGTDVGALARWDGEDWRHFGSFDGLVKDMCEHNGELWVVGEFYRVNGIVADGVARFDGATWHAVGAGPGPYRGSCIASYQGLIHVGSLGAPKVWTGTVWQTFAPSVSGFVNDLQEYGGELLIGTSIPGGGVVHAWNGSSVRTVATANGGIESLGEHAGELLVGGRFTTVGGLAARSIARWDGTSWSTFGIGVRGSTVLAMATFQGQLVIGGDFNRQQGENADYVAYWNGTGWAPFPGGAPNGAVFALLPDDARGELLVGGWYFRIGTQEAAYLGLWQGSLLWESVGTGLGSARRRPWLTGAGSWWPGTVARWQLSSAQELAPAMFVFGLSAQNAPLLGGTLVPAGDASLLLFTDAIGTATVFLPHGPALAGFEVWGQAWVLDAAGPQGATASNALVLRGS